MAGRDGAGTRPSVLPKSIRTVPPLLVPFCRNRLQSASMKIPPYEDEAFTQAIDYLYSFINFEQRPQDRYMAAKLDDGRPQRLMAAVGAPHEQFPSIHIAGTKGKGSVAAMCAASLRAAGYKVGLYTSPHLQDFRERIRILTPADADGRIPQPAFVKLLEGMKPVIGEMAEVTWFEILTAVAFLHFAREQVDVAVVEVGLGGRLDATNVVTPLVSVITSLSLDHTKFLGNTLPEIAYEKGGIIKAGVPVVTAPQKREAMEVLLQIAIEREAPLSVIGQHWQYTGEAQPVQPGRQALVITRSPAPDFMAAPAAFELALAGEHQLENGAVAVAALQVVQAQFPRLDATAVSRGLATVEWEGRLQTVHQGEETPTLLVDCAHNPDSAQKLCQALQHHFDYQNIWFIFGCFGDKDVPQILQPLLPVAAGVITTSVQHPRSATPEALAALVTAAGIPAFPAPDMDTAVRLAWQKASPDDLICVTGSIYIVGDLLNQWESLQSQLIPNKSLALAKG